MSASLLNEKNDLDFSMLEPGDILLVANPTDRWYMRYTLFWSHIGIVAGQGVIDAVRDPRGDYIEEQDWGKVQRVPYRVYQANVDIIALRVKCSPEKRAAAARYAESKIGLPFSPTIGRIIFSRRDVEHYSCASLMWQAYNEQGIDLAPLPFDLNLAVLPASLVHSPHIEIVGRGTRYKPIPCRWRNLGVILSRLWFKHVLGADIIINISG